MIELIPVTNSSELSTEFKQIYEEAFPQDERREWQQLIELLKIPQFCLNEIFHQQKFIGFYSIWNLSGFNFIEHFAIRDTERGKGFGSQAIHQILTRISTPLFLEVEESFTDAARKRIKFYEKLNFTLSDGVYYQPPYSIGKNKVKMLLMSYPESIIPDDFAAIQSGIHEVVYQTH